MKLNNIMVPQDFIIRHAHPKMVEGFEYASCKCGVDFEAVGTPQELVRSPEFKQHIVRAFKRYKMRQRQLIGGNVGG
jgi:hypothetical protein